MSKLLRTSDKILLALTFVGDTVVDGINDGIMVKKRKRIIPFTNLLPSEESRFHKSFLRLLRVGDIQRISGKDGRAYFKLSSLGEEKFDRKFPLYKWRYEKWDGNWCVVSYDIPEKLSDLRKYLKSKLESLGFGMWQKSVYISPYSQIREDLLDWINGHNLQEYVVASLSKDLTLSDNKDLASKVFSLGELGDGYQLMLDDWEVGTLTRERLFERYSQMLVNDPLLPVDLLKSSWPGLRVEDILFRKNKS